MPGLLWNSQPDPSFRCQRLDGCSQAAHCPSTASELKDDPTIVRLINFAKSWGYGALYVGNLFSIMSAHPYVLFFDSSREAPGSLNDQALKQMCGFTSTRLVGWGEWGRKLGDRPRAVLDILGQPVFCLKINKSGEPCHPLYLPGDSKLTRYSRGLQNDGLKGGEK
jgi:hypothetical protein